MLLLHYFVNGECTAGPAVLEYLDEDASEGVDGGSHCGVTLRVSFCSFAAERVSCTSQYLFALLPQELDCAFIWVPWLSPKGLVFLAT